MADEPYIDPQMNLLLDKQLNEDQMDFDYEQITEEQGGGSKELEREMAKSRKKNAKRRSRKLASHTSDRCPIRPKPVMSVIVET